jgi:hypothetical protein
LVVVLLDFANNKCEYNTYTSQYCVIFLKIERKKEYPWWCSFSL